MNFARALGATLRHCLESDPRVIVLGEDIADPYGGAFKVTRGLSTDFPGRVRNTPVSEAAIVGLAGGLALSGFRPIVEIMFGDFLGLAFDQILNHIAKFQAMYAGQVACPVIIRTPSGGGRSYGPTHSQSLEKHFLGIPNLVVAAASLYCWPQDLFDRFLAQELPVLFIEHKLLYPLEMRVPEDGQLGDLPAVMEGSPGFPPALCVAAVPRAECAATVVAYGFAAVMALKVVESLAMEEEIFAELIVPIQLAPFDYAPVLASAARTGALITVEESVGGWAWGTEIALECNRALFGQLRRPPRVVTSERDIIPAARALESEMLINENKIRQAIRETAT